MGKKYLAKCPKDGLEYPNCIKTVLFHGKDGVTPTNPHYYHEHEGRCTPEHPIKDAGE